MLGVDLFLVICPDVTVMTDLDTANPDCATRAAVATAATMIDRAMVISNPPRKPPVSLTKDNTRSLTDIAVQARVTLGRNRGARNLKARREAGEDTAKAGGSRSLSSCRRASAELKI